MRSKKLRLLRLIAPQEAWAVMDAFPPGDWAGLFGDNGGDPDGNAWLRPADEFPGELVARLVEAGVAEVVDGYSAEYPPSRWHVPPRGAAEWCGYQAEERAYWLK